MKYLIGFVLACSSFFAVTAQDQNIQVGLFEFLASPESFKGKIVSLQGYLRIDHEPRHGVVATLYIHQEDAKNLLGSNSVLIIPSAQMLRDEKRLMICMSILTRRFKQVKP